MDEKLSREALAQGLRTVANWELTGDAITRTVKLATFKEALSFVLAVGHLAEERNHHPDIDIRYRTVKLTLSTHSAGGLTAKDLELGKAIDRIIPS